MGSLDCGENQLSAAMSMEAGSRSPLPPSPSSNFQMTTDYEVNCKSPSTPSARELMSVSYDLINFSSSSKPNIPNKPPRKSVNDNKQDTKINKHSNYEPVTPPPSSSTTTTTSSLQSSAHVLKPLPDNTTNRSVSPSGLTLVIPPDVAKRIEKKSSLNSRDYEYIENITDAWKTLGIDEIKHTEHVKTPEDELLEFVWQRSNQQKSSSKETTPKMEEAKPMIIVDEQDNDGDYDHLEFFGSNSKTGSSYKTIITVVPPAYRKQTTQPVSSNDYELIGNPDTQPCRLADDSYLGYGVLRKPSLPGLNNDDAILDHRQCNGLDYAIVSKPKRV